MNNALTMGLVVIFRSLFLAQSVGAVEYTDWASAEG